MANETVEIFNVRGQFYRVTLRNTSGPGLYAIDELNQFQEQSAANDTIDILLSGVPGSAFSEPATAVSPILLTGVAINKADIISEVSCLANLKVFYTFGQAFGQVAITGEALLGGLPGTRQDGSVTETAPYDGVQKIIQFFENYRVSRYLKPIKVSISTNAFLVYLTGLKIGEIDKDYHIMPFAFFGTLLDINKDDPRAINPLGTVLTTYSVNDPSLYAALSALPLTSTSTTPSTAPINAGQASQGQAANNAGVNTIPLGDPKTEAKDNTAVQKATKELNNFRTALNGKVINDPDSVPEFLDKNLAAAEKSRAVVNSGVTDQKTKDRLDYTWNGYLQESRAAASSSNLSGTISTANFN